MYKKDENIQVIEEYEKLVKSVDFAKYSKNLSEKIRSSLVKNYSSTYEDKLVKKIFNDINQRQPIKNKNIELSTKSVFIHGNNCQVNFEYLSIDNPVELGDIIFIISLVSNNKTYFERFTINQFKKKQDKRWDIKKKNGEKQLYLLSKFPKFKGVKGLPSGKEYCLADYSNCLGSYGLLHEPGDFYFVSSKMLDSFIRFKKSINGKEINDLISKIKNYELPGLLSYALYHPAYIRHYPYLFGNYHEATHTYDFIEKYLMMDVGEYSYSNGQSFNKQAKNLLFDIIKGLESKKEYKELAERYFNIHKNEKYQEGETLFNDGSIGIFHTIVNFKEIE